jgi:hypothetical protein
MAAPGPDAGWRIPAAGRSRRWYDGPVPTTPVILVSLGIVTLVACGEPPAPEAGTGAERMASRLRSIADSADPMTNEYANALRAEVLRARQAPDPRQDQVRLFQLGRELLRAGETQEAIEIFANLLAGLPPAAGAQRQILLSWLGLSYLRIGEQENCLLRHDIDSCLLPIRESGVHQAQRGSRGAIEQFEEILRSGPDEGLRLRTQWLLNIAYMTVGEYPEGLPSLYRVPPEAFASGHDPGRFHDVAPALGLDVIGLSGGSVTEDLDGDGYLDIFVSSWGLSESDQMRLFLNNRDGTFTDHTDLTGLVGLYGGLNLKHADFDNDGDADIMVLRGAWTQGDWSQPNSLLRNDGDGRFTDVTEEAGLLDFHPTQTAAWGDYDNDGLLDVYIGNETMADRTDVHPSRLFRNNGDGTFTDVADEAGARIVGYVKAVSWGDYDNDGLLDLYASRLAAPNVLLHNDGPGPDGQVRFSDATASAGVAEPLYSFPVWWWDYDNDGWLDVWVSGYGPSRRGGSAEVAADMLGRRVEAEHPRLYRNNGDGTFEDVSVAANLDTVLYTMGSNFGDLDNDGWEDFYVGTGDPDLRTLVPNRMFRNDGGQGFQDVTTAGGFGHLQKGHGISFADLDNDGDQDVHAVMGGAFQGDVYQNALFENPGHGNRWITLRLEGTRSNRSAIGARIRVTIEEDGALREIHRVVSGGGSFGANSLQQEIGLGGAAELARVEIWWPTTGERQVVDGLEMDGVWRVVEGEDRATRVEVEALDLAPGHEPGSASAHQHTD